MHPGRITEILDLAKEARKLGHIFNPLFVGLVSLRSSSSGLRMSKRPIQSLDFVTFALLTMKVQTL